MGFEVDKLRPEQHVVRLVLECYSFVRVCVYTKMSVVFVEVLQPILQKREMLDWYLVDALYLIRSQHPVTPDTQPCFTIQLGCDGGLKDAFVIAA